MSEGIMAVINKYANELSEMKDAIWEYAELAYKEFKSIAIQKEFLEKNGFRIEERLAGLPTSFYAEYGQGTPVIALLGEYDALPSLSQKVSAFQDPVIKGGNGHGCGHCLIAPGSIGGVLAVKEAIDAGEISGTIRYYGCPAEEAGSGKGFMVREGAFSDVDAALFWHPEPLNRVCTVSMLSVISLEFNFHGKSSHAASSPHLGRSALDAVELMNVGANYLREHIPADAILHYVITNGGAAANIVPAEASVSYFIRAEKRGTLDDVFERIQKCAEGAALMTGTTFDYKFKGASDSLLENFALADVVWEKMQQAGPTQFDKDDEEFARAMVDGYKGAHEAQIEYIQKMSGKDVSGKVLSDELLPIENTGKEGCIMGSSDLGDLSHVVPTCQFNVASSPIGSPGHTWHNTAAYGSKLGTKGMLKAAEILALSAIELMHNEKRLDEVKREFLQRTKGKEYVPILPAYVKPPIYEQEDIYPEGI